MVYGTDNCPLKPIQAFSVFSVRGRGAEFLPANHKIKVLCCVVPKSAPRQLILEFTKDT